MIEYFLTTILSVLVLGLVPEIESPLAIYAGVLFAVQSGYYLAEFFGSRLKFDIKDWPLWFLGSVPSALGLVFGLVWNNNGLVSAGVALSAAHFAVLLWLWFSLRADNRLWHKLLVSTPVAALVYGSMSFTFSPTETLLWVAGAWLFMVVLTQRRLGGKIPSVKALAGLPSMKGRVKVGVSNQDYITFWAPPELAEKTSRFGTLVKLRDADKYMLSLDRRYDYKEVVAYIESLA